MKLIKDLTLFLIAILVFTGLAGSPATGAAKNQMLFNPLQKIVTTVGDSVIVQLAIDSGASLVHGYNVHIAFDTTILRLDNVTKTTTWDAGGMNFFFWKDTVTYDSSLHANSWYIDLSSYYLGRSLHINGYADIARMKFTALQHGATYLYCKFLLFQDTLLQPVLTQQSDGVIWVCPLPPGFIMVGDVNASKLINLADLSTMVAYLTGGSVTIQPITLAGDWNCSGRVDLADLSAMVAYLTNGLPRPCNLCP
jgi:hypothetical protein